MVLNVLCNKITSLIMDFLNKSLMKSGRSWKFRSRSENGENYFGEWRQVVLG